ncbi:hypothetical protein NSK_000092 [Nannochloropsis salina CCMP1776]|uniref:Aminomethyltransferase n=1 Tax=Nannochloropsis salina CCMP1776 TaxID=1027361 RepID=A0A4D9DHX8_9STRA|nr:hypothetical protein NSK_000092 [Nannochloropsis salina CCMP1776]|eukprot:TFJ88518.1 hypothetical protein NSK_000092 [Nannochloropsis salina CCMP1776]
MFANVLNGTARAAGLSRRQLLLVTSARRALGTEALEKTALFDMHLEMKGKMVPFAGYELPVLYEMPEWGGIVKEHLHCRAKASVFDVSHMGQIKWHGKDRVKFLETLVVGDVAGLGVGEARLSLLTNKDGGIIDDTIITNAGDYTYMIVNGATKGGDMAHFKEQMESFKGDVCFEYFHEQQLLALQGPSAAETLQALLPADVDLSKVNFMTGFDTTVGGLQARVTRCGYTGEDGFEVSVAWKDARALAELFLEGSGIRLAGLGARDSLRLESGLCLYGNDIDATTTPVEAALGWTMGGPKGRRRKEQGFLGAEKFLSPEGKFLPISRKRVGLAGFKAPARAHTEIFDPSGVNKIGEVTSGTFSPSLNKPIAMGYVAKDFSAEGSKVAVKVRGKLQEAEVTKMPFVTQHYYKAL